MAQRLSQLASELWPFLLPKVGAMVQGAGGGGGVSGGGTIGLHDLSGSLHKGTLADAQAPQFLLRSGARSLTGDLAVDAGVTIDGVDIGAHAVDPNAHHAKLHAITDAANHSVTGSQYQIVGLTAVNTLGLLTPSATPAANAVVKTDASSAVTLVDLTVTSDLFMTGYLDFGTDVIYEDASYLQVTGAKAVRFGQNIGNAAWTIYNTGGAAFGGSVDITGSGDLYVAGSLGGAGGVLKTSGNRVGIACVPDSQFALDVAGPARAQYFIGPHAIQLKDATMILHFDGAAPYNTNYNGILLGHKGQTATASGGYTFRPGKFQKALQIAPATTNLVAYPSLENGTLGALPTGWTMDGTGTLTKSSDVAYYGSYSGKLTVAAQQGYPNVPVVGGVNLLNAYTVSAWVWIESVTTGTLSVGLQRTDTFALLANVNIDMSKRKQWQRVTATYAGGGSGTPAARVLFGTSAGATFAAYIDGVQVEQVAYATPYCDGSLNPIGSADHSWTTPASPHASTSARTATTLYYSSGNVNAREGTVSFWAWIDGLYNWGQPFAFDSGASSFDYYFASNGAAIFRYAYTSLEGDPAGSNITGIDPKLSPLASNGGPTQTQAIAPSSPAVDSAQANGFTTDQLGQPRTVDAVATDAPLSDGTDIGAFELQDTKAPGGDPSTDFSKKPPKKVKLKKGVGKVKLQFTGTVNSGAPGPLSFECKVDKGEFTACKSPLKLKLEKGKHTVEVRAVDSSGRVDGSPAKAKIKVKKAKPKKK